MSYLKPCITDSTLVNLPKKNLHRWFDYLQNNGAQQVYSSTPKTTDYLGELIYEGGNLQFIQNASAQANETSFSPYVYVLNNPINLIDPDGNEAKLPLHFDFFIGAGLEIYKAARSQGASVIGAITILSQASIESGYGKGAPCNNFFGIMGGGCKVSTVHGQLRSFSSTSDCIKAFFEKLKKTWPEALEMLKKGKISGEDINKAYNTGDYEEYPAYMVKSEGHEEDYGETISNISNFILKMFVKSIDKRISDNQKVINSSSVTKVVSMQNLRSAVASGNIQDALKYSRMFNTANQNHLRATQENEELIQIRQELANTTIQ
jgi:hypothetical protein